MKKIIYFTIVIMLLITQTVGSFALTGDFGFKEAKCIHRYGNWTVSRKATCTGTGLETQKCVKCGQKNTRAIQATGHRFGNYRVTKNATCTSQGTETRTCSKCGLKNSRSTKALGHKHTVWKVTKKATCTTSGERYSVCIRCPNKKTEKVNALGHRWSNFSITKPPTCTAEGRQTRTCILCKSKHTISVSKKPHRWGPSYVRTVIYGRTNPHTAPATWYRDCLDCKTTGYLKTTCKNGHKYVERPSFRERWLKYKETGKDIGGTIWCTTCNRKWTTSGWEYYMGRYDYETARKEVGRRGGCAYNG